MPATGSSICSACAHPDLEPTVHLVIMLSLAAYVVLMALPFVPGVEVGLRWIFMLGAEIVPVVISARCWRW
ncbi:MAG: hypothetical protein R3C69_05600 [Geminicoccaceae bacterium]